MKRNMVPKNMGRKEPTAAAERAAFRKAKEAKDRFKRRQMTGKNR